MYIYNEKAVQLISKKDGKIYLRYFDGKEEVTILFKDEMGEITEEAKKIVSLSTKVEEISKDETTKEKDDSDKKVIVEATDPAKTAGKSEIAVDTKEKDEITKKSEEAKSPKVKLGIINKGCLTRIAASTLILATLATGICHIKNRNDRMQASQLSNGTSIEYFDDQDHDIVYPNGYYVDSTTATTAGYNTTVVDNVKTTIDTATAIDSCTKLCNDMWKQVSKNISYRSICSTYFIVNYEFLTDAAKSAMIEKGLISNEVNQIFGDSMEMFSTVQNLASRYVSGNGKGVIYNYAKFCENTEDKALLKYAYDQVVYMKNASECEDDVEIGFDDFYSYINNFADSNFPIIDTEANAGASFLLCQGYGPVYCMAAGEIGYKDADRERLENTEETRMNDIATIYRSIASCDYLVASKVKSIG